MDDLTLEEHITWHQDPLQCCAGQPVIPQYNFEPLAKVLIGVEDVTKSVEDLVLLFFEEAKKYTACGGNLDERFAVIRKPPNGWGKLIDKIKGEVQEVLDEDLIPIVVPPPVIVDSILAVNDVNIDSPVNGTAGQTNVLNVFTNDTLKGLAVNPAEVVLSEIIQDPSGVLVLNADGSIDVVAGSLAGVYTLTYKICQVSNPENCDTAVVTVAVDAIVEPEPDVQCDDNFTFSGSSGVKDIVINFGVATGECGIDYNPAAIPDRFQIIYDGVIVADSLFKGSASYADNLAALGYLPAEMDLGSPTNGSLRFTKSNPTPSTAIIRVNAPFAGTYWSISGVCPL